MLSWKKSSEQMKKYCDSTAAEKYQLVRNYKDISVTGRTRSVGERESEKKVAEATEKSLDVTLSTVESYWEVFEAWSEVIQITF